MSIKLQAPSQIITNDETLEVVREGQVIYVDAKPVKRDITRFTVTCNVQPMNGRDLLLVPEGDRHKEQYWVFTNNTQKPMIVNDMVIRKDLQGTDEEVHFQVQEIQNWGSFQETRIMRIDVGPNATP